MSTAKNIGGVNQEFEDHLALVRRKLSSLWFAARDQTQDPPAFDRAGALEAIDDDVSEIAVTLNFLEDSFRALESLARKAGAP